MARGYFALFDIFFAVIALAFYQYGASLSGYRTDMVQNGLFLGIVAVGLVVVGLQMLRLIRGNSSGQSRLDPIWAHFLTYGIMIALVTFAGIAGLTLQNWQENKYLAAFVIAVVAAVVIFIEDIVSLAANWRQNRS